MRINAVETKAERVMEPGHLKRGGQGIFSDSVVSEHGGLKEVSGKAMQILGKSIFHGESTASVKAKKRKGAPRKAAGR